MTRTIEMRRTDAGTRVRWNRRSLISAMEAAKAISRDGETWYVYATARGFEVTRIKPSPAQRFYAFSGSRDSGTLATVNPE